MYLILASKSPRRREILLNAGYNIKISASNVDEVVSEVNPEDKVLAIAKKKGLDVYQRFENDNQAIILSADTIVVIDNEILGKPNDKDDARNMISKLQGRTHNVYTAVYIKSKDYEDSFVEKTEVTVSNMTEEEIENYISSNEPYDKAGGYAIQGLFSQYINGINGDFYNVMGLPINKVKLVLSKYDLSNKLVCQKCGNEVKESDNFCLKCGTKINVVSRKKMCSKCHRINKNESKFCEFCGNDLSDSVSFTYDENECPICHHVNKAGTEYCESCGTIMKLNEEVQKAVNIQKKIQSKKDYTDTAFTMGILSLATTFLCGVYVSTVFSVLACVFGGISLARGYRGKSLAAVIMGGMSIILTLAFIILVIALMS